MAYKLSKKPSESKPSLMQEGMETAGRIVPQSIAGVGAVAAGIPGNIFSGINQMIANPLTKAFGGEEVPYEQTHLGKVFPTTQTHLKNLQEAAPILKPRNKVEKFVNDTVVDAAELYGGGQALRMGRYAFSPMRSLGISLAANTAGEATEQYTGDEGKANMVKSGTMLGLSLFNPTSARNVVQDLYQRAGQALPQNATVNATRLQTGLGNLRNRIMQGRNYDQLAPTERFVIDNIERFEQLINNGQANVSQLTAQKRSFNEELQNNLYNLTDRAGRGRARELAQGISHEVNGALETYGTQNPQWWNLQRGADQAHGAIQQSNRISRALEKFMGGRPEALAHVFGVGIPAGLSLVSPQLGALSAAGYQASKLMTRITRSPELRRHYAKVAGAALADNPKLINKELDTLDEKIEKEQKGKYKLVKSKK